MWSKGNLKIGEKAVHYCVKHYEKGSQYGIKRGKISKLTLKSEGEIIANFDRGWDIKAEDETAKAALAILMKEYN